MANLAVILEPFPLRNSLGAHAWIGERLCRMLLHDCAVGFAVADMRIVCNAPTMSHICQQLPAARPYLVQPDVPAQGGFAALIADWHTAGLRTWSSIQLGSTRHEALYEALLRSVQRLYPFDVLAYWGTNETLRAVADRLRIPVIWAEYGPLRPPFPTQFCLDQKGVNGLSSSRREVALADGLATFDLPAAALETAVGATTAYEATLTLPSAGVTDAFAALMRFVKGFRRVIVLVLQLADDANILAFGNGWTCYAMVEAALQTLADAETVFILRPHPGEGNAYHTHAAGAAVVGLVQDRADVLVFDEAGPEAYLACLSVATEVVCINSSVGFEAALLGKPVRVLGEASYMPPGPGAAMSAPPVRLKDESMKALLADHYIPEQRFWTLACWRKAAAAAWPGAGDRPISVPHLPTAAAKRLGRLYDLHDGTMLFDDVGTLGVGGAALGAVDGIVMEDDGEDRRIRVSGWAADGHDGGMFAGFIMRAGDDAIWCAEFRPRPDVAAHLRCAVKLPTGFAMRIALKDLPSAMHSPTRVYGVSVAGTCHPVGPEWAFNAAGGCFDAVAEP